MFTGNSQLGGKLDNLAISLGILAGFVQLVGYWKYNQLLARGEVSPNATSWALWGMGGIVEYVVYADLARDWAKEFLPMVCAIAVFFTFVHMLWRGAFQRPDKVDVQLFSLDAAVAAFWILTKNPYISNVFLGFDIVLSHIPILRATWKKSTTEKGAPWLIWTSSYAILTLAIILRWDKWWDLIYPLCYLFLCGIMWAIVRFRYKKATSV